MHWFNETLKCVGFSLLNLACVVRVSDRGFVRKMERERERAK